MFWTRRRKRQLFSYWDGSRTRRIDPLRALDALAEYPGYNSDTCKMAEAGDREAEQLTLAAARAAFGVKEYDDQTSNGLTWQETADLLEQFADFIDGLKKNTSGFARQPPSTDATLSASSEPTTSATLPSAATSGESATNGVETSAPESAGP